MFRRSRFSVRPNVSTAGRIATTPQDTPSSNQEASETPRDVGESSTPAAVTDTKAAVTPSEKPTTPEDGNDQNGEGTSSSAAVQRRKRFSVKPRVAPGRPSTLPRTPKSPVKAVCETPVEVSSPNLEKPTTSSQTGTAAAPQGLQSPRRRKPSGESKHPKVQPKPTPTSSDSAGPSVVPVAEESLEQTDLPKDTGKQLENKASSQVKEAPHRPSDKVPPSLPDKEAIEISEKAKTLVSSKSGLSLSPSAFSLSRLLNDPSDLQRLAKAQKLRDLLRQERHKEKKLKKAKARAKEYTLDPAKMTMRDLIRYLPVSNPMTSSLEDSSQENETVVPPSPGREESPERAQEPEALPKIAEPEEEEVVEDEQEEALMVPRVKVAEDGSLIIDEESLTVEVQRAKGPNPAHDRDPIFERGSTTTYSSFRKGTYSKPWSSEETDMFFLAISMVGTDFSMICQLFPHRARSEIKNKFKKEERENAWRIDKAFRERRKLDIEYFSKLLEKILEVQKNRKKLKSLADKNSPKKHKRKAKGKKTARKLSDVEEEEGEDENEVPDLEDEEEGEKENEDLYNEGGTSASKPKRQCKRKTRESPLNEEPNDKKKKTGEKSNKQGEACTPEDTEAALPGDHTSSDMSEKTENVNAPKDTAIKPAKLSHTRASKSVLPLGRKWGKKPPPPSTKTVPDKGDETVSDGASEEQANKDSSPSADISSEEEDATIQPPKPTRYGRVPKPTKPLTYPAKENAHTSDTTPTSPVGSTGAAAKPKPKCTAKRGRSSKQPSAQESKKPKLVTLRASRSEFSDDEDEKQLDHEEIEDEVEHPACSPSKDSIAPVFVPVSLRSPQPVISEVEETMEELDILANMPDVLGISQDALCPDASCERAQNETGTVEPCEHQLDLLVDVIDFLSSEHTEVTEDESYNEAAQTLLAIGTLTHLPQSTTNQIVAQDHTTGTTTDSVRETRQPLEEDAASEPAAQEEDSAVPLMFVHGVAETSEITASAEPQNSTADSGDIPIIKTSDQMCAEQSTVSEMDSQLQSSPECSKKSSPQPRRGRLSTVKCKPNLGRASKTAQPKSQPDTSTEQTAEEGNTEPANLQVTDSVSAPEERTPTIPESSSTTLIDDISCTEVRPSQELSASQERSHCSSDAQFEPSGEQTSGDTKSTQESSNEELMSRAEIISSCSNYLATSDTPVTGSQFELGSNCDSVPVEESGQHPAALSTPLEDSPVSQKTESDAASACQSRRNRLQKVKPKPNIPQISRTARPTPQTTKDCVEKDSSPTPSSKVQEKTTVEVESEATCGTSLEKTSQNIGPASVCTLSFDLGSTLTPTKKLSTIEEKRIDTDVGLVGQVHSVAASSDQSASENHNLSDADNPMTSDSAATVSQVGQNSAPRVQESSDHPATCATPAEDLPVSQKEESEVTSTCQTRRGRLQKVRPKPNLVQTSRTARSKPQTTKEPVQHMQLVERPSVPTSAPGSADNVIAEVEALPVCSITLPEPGESSGTASVSVPSLELCTAHKPAEESSSTMEQKADVGLNSSSASSESNVPQRRRHLPKVKPNLGSSTRTKHTKNIVKPLEEQYMDPSSNVTSEPQQPVDNSHAQPKCTEEDCKNMTLNTELSSTKSVPTEKKLDSKNDKGTSSDDVVIATSWVAENQSMLTDTVPDDKSSEKFTFEREPTGDRMSSNDRVEAGPASQGDYELDMSTRLKELNAQPAYDPAAVSDVHSSEGGSTESKVNSVLAANAHSIPDPKESSPQPSESEETRETNQTSNDKSPSAESADDTQSELTDSSKSSKKALQSRRARLIKPKPNLGCSSRPPQPQQDQNTTQAEDPGTPSERVDASVSHKPVSKLQPDIQEPVEGAVEPRSPLSESPPNDAGALLGSLTQIIEQLSEHDSPPNDAGSSLDCVTQTPDNSSQDTSTLNAEETQSHPSLPIFPDMLSEQVPSDPDEPFFILSLTEIPVCSSGDVVDTASEPLPYLPVADASVPQQSSVPGECLAAEMGDGALYNVSVPMSTEESGEMGPSSVKDTGPDPAANLDSIMENLVDPHESMKTQPPKLSEAVENNDETEILPTKQGLTTRTGRRAKLQVKPNTSRKKQTSKTLATNIDQDSELPGPSMQPEASDATAKADDEVVTEPRKRSSDHVNIEKETPADGKSPKDNRSGARTQTTKTGGTSAENSSDTSSDPSSGKAASEGLKVKTPHTPRKHSTPTPVASTSHNVAPTPNPTQLPEDTRSTSSATSPTLTEVVIEQATDHNRQCSDSTPSTSQLTAEVSASQQSDYVESSSTEEEPTSVSQYFLSDIFTDVEEG
ncbi:transcription factor TFIIIB component B'' homolog isoform X2 [Toxotes jaculatrix]|uniref:transcription factor TFIIIB component B'' homolog isoform X2 n=1 Tax=Toxotes jaculatrix TaxID=941984 RepID=UPI001B3B1501|nr:transcription factor TFIIIB component B'' homolog isoform X2 [Toxotes jaculatrix]